MNKILKFLLAVAMCLGVSASAFEEGVDYVKLEKDLPVQKGTLTKVFSYACPFCYKYDKAVTPKVVAGVEGLEFVPFHLKTKGDYGEAGSKIFAVLIAMDKEAGVSLLDKNSKFKKAKFAYYKAYHDKKQRWENGKNLDAYMKTGLDAAGVSMDEYNAKLSDPVVVKMLSDWDSSYDVAKIQGVPAFVVDGKYLLYTSKIKSIDSMIKLIKFLQTK